MARQEIRTKQIKLQLWIDRNVAQRLRILAKKEGRTVTDLCREAIADLLLKRDIEQIIKSKGVK